MAYGYVASYAKTQGMMFAGAEVFRSSVWG